MADPRPSDTFYWEEAVASPVLSSLPNVVVLGGGVTPPRLAGELLGTE